MDTFNVYGQPRTLPLVISWRINLEVDRGMYLIKQEVGNIARLRAHTIVADLALRVHPVTKGRWCALYGLHTGVWRVNGADLPVSHRFAPPVIQ